MTLINNKKYEKIFAELAKRTVDQLKEQFMLMDIMTMTPERSLVKACTFEQIQSMIGEVEANSFLDAMDSLQLA